MKESDTEGIANHSGPESCVRISNGVCEALTGVHAGWVLSPEKRLIQSADVVKRSGRQHLTNQECEIQQGSAWSETPSMHGNLLHGNREIPCTTQSTWVCAENPIGESRQ